MKILGLYNNAIAEELFTWLEGRGHTVLRWQEPLEVSWCLQQNFDLAVSYTYRYILNGDQLKALHYNAVNIYNSYLPWNRGADPNIWSLLEGTPRGVTLHFMNTGLDKGHIIAQRLVPFEAESTLRASYNQLDSVAKQLFKDAFQYYNFWRDMCKQVEGAGTYHSVKDGQSFRKILESYDVPTTEFLQKYREFRNE